MAKASLWAVLLLISASNLAHGTEQAVGNVCTEEKLQTAGGEKPVGCEHQCTNPNLGQSGSTSGECINTSPEAVKYMTAGVNHTCTLGLCGSNMKCEPSGLYIACWK
ncbi:evasin P1181-like [Dermacentor silvarum]|uniref:evasin P1181-like n=1 Tax=Dermacentor silvarum TaxID=543639 RepID=UPI0021006F7A|nr:evasin P1181-like [Dermacentor silvarum]